MAATTSWSNQLTRLFNAPLDKESVFDTKNDLLQYLKRDEIPYEGQIVAIIDNTDGTETDKVMRIYAIAKDSNRTLPDSDVTLGDHGNRWYLLTIGTSNIIPDYSEETGKLKDKVNIKIKGNSDFDGKTGVDFDGSTNIEIPLELKVQDQLKNIDDAGDTTVDKDIFTKVKVNSRGLVVEGYKLAESDIPQLGQSKITFGVKQPDGSLNPNKLSDLNISDKIDSLNNVNLTSPTNLQVISYDATSGKWVNNNMSTISGGDKVLNFGGTNADVTGSGTGVGTGNEIALKLNEILANGGTFTKLTVNKKGLVTATANLVKTDIPKIDDDQVDFSIKTHDFSYFNLSDKIDNLSNVSITNITNKDILVYDSTTQKWTNVKKDDFVKHNHKFEDLSDTSVSGASNKEIVYFDANSIDNGDGTFTGQWKAGSLKDLGIQPSGKYVKEDDVLSLNTSGDVKGTIQFSNSTGNNVLELKEILDAEKTLVKVKVDKKGRVISGDTKIKDADIEGLNWSKITNTPTTLGDYGITDAYNKNYYTKIASMIKADGSKEIFENHPVLLSSNGKLDPSVIPNISLANIRTTNNEADMITYSSILTGDICIRSDIYKTFIYAGANMSAPEGSTVTSNVSDWLEMLTPTNYITAIKVHGDPDNLKKGSVVELNYSDMDAVPTLIKSGDLATSDPTPKGEYTKVKVNDNGLVISGSNLTVKDLPNNIPQSKIVFGQVKDDPDHPGSTILVANNFNSLNISEKLSNLSDTNISADPVGKILYNEAIVDGTDPTKVIGNRWVDKTLKELGATAVLEKDLNVVIPESIGGVNNGDVFTKGTTIETILKKLFTKASPVNYIAPTSNFSDSLNNMKEVETGTSLGHTLNYSFTKNDAGDLTSWSVVTGSTTLAQGTNTLTGSPLSVASAVVNEGVQKYVFTCNYGDGPIKKDTLGNDSPSGQIKAGSLVKELTVTGKRAYFGHASTDTTAPVAGDVRRVRRGIGAKNGTKITVNVNIGDQLVMFAYPASVQDCTQIKYEEINDINAKSKFTQISLQVNDASGANPVDYRVYYYIAAVPFAASATFVLTI